MKRIIGLLLASIIVLAACSGGGNSKKVTVGVASNDTAAWEKVKELAKKDDIDLEIKHFSDYNVPNKALSDGDIDMNAFQHFAFLNEYKKAHKDAKIEAISTTVLAPLGIYSKKVKDIKDVKDGAQVMIPNDVSNQARALKLLESAGLIKLKDKTNLNSTEKDIAENPKNLKFTAMDAPSIAQVYKDAGAAVINSNFAIGQGLDPTKDSIFLEPTDSPYANLVAIRKEDADKEKFKKFLKVLNSEEAKKFIEEKFKGAVIPAFEK